MMVDDGIPILEKEKKSTLRYDFLSNYVCLHGEGTCSVIPF